MNKRKFFGVGSISYLNDILQRVGARKILLVTGKNSYTKCGAESKINKIVQRYEVGVFNDFRSNPDLTDVKKGVEVLQKFNPDVICAIGGGSVIDIAKLIKYFGIAEINNIENIIKNSQQKCVASKIKLIAIPTTSGTGSEATEFAVLYVNKIKESIENMNIMPNYSIIDPRFTYNSPKSLVSVVGLDTLAQAIESYWSNKSTLKSKKYARFVIKVVLENLVKAYNGDKEAKNELSKASYLSGKAINISKTTAPHAISYTLTSNYGIPHGYAVALTLGYFFRINYEEDNQNINDSRGVHYVKSTMKEIFDLLSVNNAESAKKRWDVLLRQINLKPSLKQLGFARENDINKIINGVNLNRLKNNPVKVKRKTLEEIFA